MAVQILMPQMGESIAEGTLVRWLKKVGDAVDRDEPLFEISTDKVDAEIPSPTEGILTAIHVKEGELAAVNSVVGVISAVGEAAGTASAEPRAAEAAPAAVTAAPAARAAASRDGEMSPAELRRLKSSPLVRRLAKEHAIDISTISGSGLDGRVTKGDIEKVIALGAKAPKPGPVTVQLGDRVEAMSVMRRKIADHMIFSQKTSAHAHTLFHVNFSTIDRLRKEKKTDFEKSGAKLTYMAFIAKAVIDAIGKYPVMNASVDGNNIVYKKDINLGIAVSLDNGLIVPVIKGAGTLSMTQLAKAIADVANRARSKKLNPEEVNGGTFTITNPGQYGAQFGLPVINQPQLAILCIGTVEKRPVVVDDAIGIRLMSYLTLGFDHRVIDGAVADEFMASIKRQIETFDPATL